jgi:TonB family protein
VKINGALVSTIRDLDEFTGYFGVESTSTKGIGFRNFRAIRLPQAHEQFGADAHSITELGLVRPQKIEDARPFYPREAFDARIEGTVGLQAVVQANGSVGDIRVTKPLEPNLDEAAIGSARKWRFKPATMDGERVDVVVWFEISFTVGRGPR